MARKRTLNERRLTKRQVQELISSGARPRPDLTAALDSALPQSRVYELGGDRYLMVFGELSGLGGKGDVYSGDDVRRFVRWTAKVDEDARHGRQGSVRHWAYYSALKDRLTSNIDTLVAQLRSAMSRTADDLDFSYQSLDVVSEYVEVIGVERAQQELCDHLVAYVGEVLKARIHGRWQLRRDHPQPHPYLVGAKHDRTMPINAVWQELSGLAPVNLGTVAANEARRTRKLPGFIADVATSVQAAAPEGVLATLQADATRSRNDGRMAGCGSSPSTPRRNNSAHFHQREPVPCGDSFQVRTKETTPARRRRALGPSCLAVLDNREGGVEASSA